MRRAGDCVGGTKVKIEKRDGVVIVKGPLPAIGAVSALEEIIREMDADRVDLLVISEVAEHVDANLVIGTEQALDDFCEEHGLEVTE